MGPEDPIARDMDMERRIIDPIFASSLPHLFANMPQRLWVVAATGCPFWRTALSCRRLPGPVDYAPSFVCVLGVGVGIVARKQKSLPKLLIAIHW